MFCKIYSKFFVGSSLNDDFLFRGIPYGHVNSMSPMYFKMLLTFDNVITEKTYSSSTNFIARKLDSSLSSITGYNIHLRTYS